MIKTETELQNNNNIEKLKKIFKNFKLDDAKCFDKNEERKRTGEEWGKEIILFTIINFLKLYFCTHLNSSKINKKNSKKIQGSNL